MIPDIGLLIGVYVIFRALQIANLKETSIVIKVVAGVAVLVSAFVIYDLLVAGTRQFPPMP